MCRLRMPDSIRTAHQLRGLAAIADTFAGGHADLPGLVARRCGDGPLLVIVGAVVAQSPYWSAVPPAETAAAG